MRDTHAVCDAGHKSHAIDSGLPTVAQPARRPRAALRQRGDEHGILYAEGDKARLPAWAACCGWCQAIATRR